MELTRRRGCGVLSRFALAVTFVAVLSAPSFAETVRNATHLVPTGKGWGESHARTGSATSASNGISYHGGPLMLGNINVYFIWYGNWTSGPHASDRSTTVGLLDDLFGINGAGTGIGGSGYEDVNTTYYDGSGQHVSGEVALLNSTTDSYSQGSRLSDSKVQAVVANAIKHGLGVSNGVVDTDGIYFVLTSSDVSEISGFCTKYCGWHTHATINGADIKYSFVGNPDRCPSACEWQTNSPNGDSGADGMASVMAHESEEAISDPDLNAWYDSRGEENADKCAWKFGPTGTIGGALYNQSFGGHNWLIQLNWENANGGGCEQTLGGPFYTN